MVLMSSTLSPVPDTLLPVPELELQDPGAGDVAPFKTQLLKWVGNKQRFAHEIASSFPAMDDSQTYFEPFLGSAAVLGTLQPKRAVGSDVFHPLVQIWQGVRTDPQLVKSWYEERWIKVVRSNNRRAAYEAIKASYNASPNGADLLFLSRSCYGGVVRFRKKDGYMSTPMGAHNPISPESFNKRVNLWSERVSGASFKYGDYKLAFAEAKTGDVIYCDPPYTHSQSILYGAQSFSLVELMEEISAAKSRGVYVALSIDGKKQTNASDLLKLPIPEGLFEREKLVNVGRSMLKRFQMGGSTLEDHVVADRLLLTY